MAYTSTSQMYMNHLDFYCDYCDRSFTRKYNLQNHIEKFHNSVVNGTWKCHICQQKFASQPGLQVHLSKGHNSHNEVLPECDICGRVFARKQNIISHMITMHLQGSSHELKCKVCDKSFATDRNLRRHVNVMHNPDTENLTCNICHMVFKSKANLKSHLQIGHNSDNEPINKCAICNDRVFSETRNLRRHMENCHGDKQYYKCDLCPKVYPSNQSLKRHTRNTHYTRDVKIEKTDSTVSNNSYESEDEYTCTTCNDIFFEESDLRHHIKTDHSFETFYRYCKSYLEKTNFKDQITNCEFCYMAFVNVSELKQHMKAVHCIEYSFAKCNVCFGNFFSDAAIVEHKKICLPPPNVHSCSHCDKLFTDVLSLDFHTRIFHPQAQVADSNISSSNLDDQEGNYKCTDCGRFYYSERSLRHHIKIKHTGQVYSCNICGVVFNSKYTLGTHRKVVHCKETLECDYCEKTFKFKRNIQRHILNTHLGSYKHKCIECASIFKAKRNLIKHIRAKHAKSSLFPQCHLCFKRFESAKTCKIHLKLIHSFNINTYPCHLCSVSFNSGNALENHLATQHLAENEVYKCKPCDLILTGISNFETHNTENHSNDLARIDPAKIPSCVICMKLFSSRKTLKRHIKKFHLEFLPEELLNCAKEFLTIDCESCIRKLNSTTYINIYNVTKSRNAIIFKCKACKSTVDALEFAVQKQRLRFGTNKTKMVLSELCTTEMSDTEPGYSGSNVNHEPVSTTNDNIKIELQELLDETQIKDEPMSP